MLSHVIWARETRVKPLSAKTVLLVLASHANKENKAYPSIPLLAKECSMTEQGVLNAIKALSQGNPPYLAVNRASGKHNTYWLMMDEVFTQQASEEELTPQPSLPPNYVDPPTTFTLPPNYVDGYPQTTLTPPLNDVGGKEQGKEIMKEQGKDKEIPVVVALSISPAEPAKQHSSVAVKDSKAQRGTRWAEDRTVPQEWKDWAKTTYPSVNVDIEALKFENYWAAKAGSNAIKVSWEKTWKGWILRNATDSNQPPTFNPTHKPGVNNGYQPKLTGPDYNARMLAQFAINQSKDAASHPSETGRVFSDVKYTVEGRGDTVDLGIHGQSVRTQVG